jgi:hypothetical protein
MFLIQGVYYQANTAFIGASMLIANGIVGADNANVVNLFHFTSIIGDIALNTPNLGLSNSFCNDPVVKIIRDGLTSIVGVLTALGVAVAVVGIIIGGLMRATAWGSEQRIAMSNKAISSAVLGLIIVLLGVILGTAVPTWFGLQNSTCPLSLPTSAPVSGPSSPSGPTSSSTSGLSLIASSSSMASLSSLVSTEQKPISASNRPQAMLALSPATPLSVPAIASVPLVPQTMLDYTYQEFNRYTNLTNEGTLDWKQWGSNQATDVNHKAGVDSQISNITLVGDGHAGSNHTNPINFTWSDGAPSQSAFGGTGAIAMTGLNHGFSITVPASTTPRTLRLYLGANLAKGLFTASLNGVARQDATLDMRHNPMRTGDNALYTIYYSTNTPDQELTITYTILETNGSAGYILLEAATLQ